MTSSLFKNDRCLIVGEVAQAHDGSLGMAHAYIDAIAAAGADAVKFQVHIAEAESTLAEPWRIRFSQQDESRFAYWKRMEFTEVQWHGLKKHAVECGLKFIASPFSLEAIGLMMNVGVDAWKAASGEVNNIPMLERMANTGIPVILSSGMNCLSEMDAAVERLDAYGHPLAVLQCTSKYPCPPELVGLNMIAEFRDRYACAVGLSDHSGTIFPGLAAATLGIEVLEVHVTMSRELFGPDVTSSVTTSEMAQLVTGIRFIETMRAHPLNKDGWAEQMTLMRSSFTKSICTRIDLPEQTVLREEHLTVKKPGTGIPASRLPEIMNRRLKRAIPADTFLSEEDLD